MGNASEAFTGTREIAAGQAMDQVALSQYLQQHLPGFEGPLQIEQFKGGQSNPTFKLRTPARDYVMRAKPGPAAKLLASAHAIDREYRIMSALASTGVPVPPMHLLCEDESIIGRAFYIMDFVEGRVLWEPSLPELTSSAREAHYDDMNRVIAALHQVDVHAQGLADYGRPGNYFERQIGRWSKQYLASVTGPNPAMDHLLAWLPEHIPPGARDEGELSIVHGDYRLDNLIFHPSEPKVIAVLDWELSTLGHPLADFSYHCMAWHIPPGLFRGLAGLDLPALGIPSESDYVRRYAERTGRGDAVTLMTDWNFYLAYNLFRIAAIAQGIAKRAQDGTAASAQAQATGEAAPRLAELAWDFALRAQG